MAPHIGYNWEDPDHPPDIQSHSVAKHEVLGYYLRRYLAVLTSNRRQETFRIHLVDGFCGGGRYKRNGLRHDGSPLILLKTVQQAEKEISSAREKDFKIHGYFYFIDEDCGAIATLRRVIAEEGFNINAGNIYINNSTFLEAFPHVMDMIRTAPGTAKRTLVVLDQYGYTDVPFAVIRTIFDALPNAEVLVTLAVDALINFMRGRPELKKSVENLGFADVFDSLESEAAEDVREHRHLVQRLLRRLFRTECGAQFCLPFFITPTISNRSLWFVHLSNHLKAREEMLAVHWEFTNHFIHQGHGGLDMLGFRPDRDDLRQGRLDFRFDEVARRLTDNSLLNEIPDALPIETPMTVRDFVLQHCNETPATVSQMRHAMFQLMQRHIVDVLSPAGHARRTADAIKLDDWVIRRSQQILI